MCVPVFSVSKRETGFAKRAKMIFVVIKSRNEECHKDRHKPSCGFGVCPQGSKQGKNSSHRGHYPLSATKLPSRKRGRMASGEFLRREIKATTR
jgi:hypothetical protein